MLKVYKINFNNIGKYGYHTIKPKGNKQVIKIVSMHRKTDWKK